MTNRRTTRYTRWFARGATDTGWEARATAAEMHP